MSSLDATKPTNTNPTPSKPTFGKQMGKSSPNANIDRKGSFEGTAKKHTQTITKKKSSTTAPSGAFGKARDMGGGRHNYSTGAPGHHTGSK